MNVRTIFSTDAKGQSSAYRIGFAKALEDGYPYCMTVEGNNKDSVEQIPEFPEPFKKVLILYRVHDSWRGISRKYSQSSGTCYQIFF